MGGMGFIGAEGEGKDFLFGGYRVVEANVYDIVDFNGRILILFFLRV